MPEPISLPTRIKGAIFGQAVSDALGGPVEFKSRGSFDWVTTMLPNDNFDLPPGHFTDDTSMALCLAHSLLSNNGHSNIVDQVKRYLSWWRHGYMSSTGDCFDIGVSTESALRLWESMLDSVHGGDTSPAEEALVAMLKRVTDQFARSEEYCGNSSLMRVLPVALLTSSESDAMELAQQSSLPTHPHLRCVHACMIYTSLIQRTLDGASKTEIAISLSEAVNNAPSDSFDISIEPVLAERIGKYRSLNDWQQTTAKSIRSTGYVVDSLEASLWAFFTSNDFEDAAKQAVNLGDDADTVGAVSPPIHAHHEPLLVA